MESSDSISDIESTHQIQLIDSTESQARAPNDPAAGSQLDLASPSSSRVLSRVTTELPLSRKWTLRQEIARRRYSKFQERKYSTATTEPGGADELGIAKFTSNGDKLEVLARQEPTAAPKSQIDILYENQRGWTILGTPLFSQKSLLNLDPAPWVNSAFKKSLVDITNAQPPDPSWEWAWRSWFVDMSGDVDEEGWQYSFAFSPRFSWHGTPVWFHAFVRRRRWLRKRVERHDHAARDSHHRLSCGQDILNPEYFTVELKGKDIARSSAIDTLDKTASQTLKIDSIDSLMDTLPLCTIDREKLEAVASFLTYGEEELFYLSKQMPDIISSLIFQESRRQLLAHLLHTADAASAHRDEHAQGAEALERKINNLMAAVAEAQEQVNRLEFWSDVEGEKREGEDGASSDKEEESRVDKGKGRAF